MLQKSWFQSLVISGWSRNTESQDHAHSSQMFGPKGRGLVLSPCP